jgi:hypothetical protein
VEPGGKLGVAVEVLEATEGVQEGVLNDIAGVLVGADDAAGDGEEAGGLGSNQLLIGGVVPATEPGEQFCVVNGRVRAAVALTLIECLRQPTPY